MTDEQRMAFRKQFTAHIRARGENHREFARAFYGETRDNNGYVIPRNPGSVLGYLNGESWPTADKARQIAAFLKVPMDTLLVDNGQPLEPIPLVRPGRATPKHRKMNGHGKHGGNGAAAHVVSPGAPALAADHAPLASRPADAKPAQLHVDSLPDAPEWCQVVISGTVRYDTAMALVNLVGRDQHGMGPRHK